MKTTITKSEFTSEFHKMGRGDQFSHSALLALYDYFTDIEEDTGSEIELDVIAICCEYTEYPDLEEIKNNYPDIETIEDLYNNTQVIECDNGSIVIADF